MKKQKFTGTKNKMIEIQTKTKNINNNYFIGC